MDITYNDIAHVITLPNGGHIYLDLSAYNTIEGQCTSRDRMLGLWTYSIEFADKLSTKKQHKVELR